MRLQQQKRPRFKIGSFGLRCGAISASAVAQGCLGGPETPIRAKKGSGLAEISAIQGVTPPEALRRISLEIGLRGGAISALAVDQGCPETRIRAGKSSADAEISVLQGRRTHRNQCIHIFWFKVARYFLADSCFKSPYKPCNSSAQSKNRGVSAKSLHNFWKWTSIELFPFIVIISSITWNEAALVY